MADAGDTNAEIWKSAETAKTFAVQSAQRERDRAEQLTFVGRLLPYGPEDTFTFLDLGAGTGAATRALLADYPHAQAILADFSRAMMAEGEHLLAPYAGRYRYVEFDLLSSIWPSEIPQPLDAVVSTLSVHHLPDARKQTLFREIRERLRPGGWYVNYDPVKAPDETLERIWQRVNDRYDPNGPNVRANRTPEELRRYENHVRYMIPLDPQLVWFRAAGFENVDLYWKRLDWVIYAGSAPTIS
jgi:tRNA (cmo5U34)-methyltransferase